MLFIKLAMFVLVALAFLVSGPAPVTAQVTERRLSLGVLDFGETPVGRLAAAKLAANLRSAANIAVQDQDQIRAAAGGAGYTGSINLSLEEARQLGSVLGSDFYLVGDAQTLRRSPSSGSVYFESYASLFLVSARTGRLVLWDRPMFEAPTATAAESSLIAKLSSSEVREHLTRSIQEAHQRNASSVSYHMPAASRSLKRLLTMRSLPKQRDYDSRGHIADLPQLIRKALRKRKRKQPSMYSWIWTPKATSRASK